MEQNNQNKVLIFGGFGFIGYHLTHKLVGMGKHVIVFGRESKITKDAFKKLEARYPNTLELLYEEIDDLSLHELVHDEMDISEVYHLAARKSTTGSPHGISLLEDNSYTDSQVFAFCDDLVRHKRAKGDTIGCKLLYMSSGEVHGSVHAVGKPVDETTPCVIDPTSNSNEYLASKVFAEMVLRFHPNKLFDWTIMRLQNPYGPYMDEKQVIPKMLRRVVGGKGSVELAMNDTRPFIYIDDVVDAMILMMKSKKANGNTYNVTGKENIGMQRLIKSMDVIADNLFFEKKNVIGTHRKIDISAIKKDLYWEPRVSIEEGVQRMRDYYVKSEAIERAMRDIGL